MTIDVEISGINKTDRMSPHERIRAVGGVNPNGKRWKLALDDAIAGIKDGRWRFWTRGGGLVAWVEIARSAWGHEYLKTQADGANPDNLLALPELP